MSRRDSESNVVVSLPDGSERAFPEPVTVEDVAYDVGPGLGDDCVAGLVDGDLVAPEHRIESDADLRVVTPDSAAYRRVLRHSAAHVLAQAVLRRYPDAELAIGPPTDEGFYYDFDGIDVDEDDLDAIEAEMRDIVEADYDVVREAVAPADARERLADQPYKQALLDDVVDAGEPVTFYRQGEFVDLCAGPHVASTGDVEAFSLLEIAGAYWRGDEDEPMLTRIYGTAFESDDDLDAYLDRRRQAEERDHRKIGRELDLFSVPDYSPGCPHYHPNGMTVRRELAEFVREKNAELGYDEVSTPELNKAKLWKPTGHYDAFRREGEMFAWEQDGTEYGLKPMNCANHAHLYDRRRFSYRDLPVRFSEFGDVYRNEQSGELSGLLRVRRLTQDDGHAFVRPDQLEAELTRTIRVIEDIYDEFDLEVLYKLETKGENAVGGDEIWETATDALRAALDSEGLAYDVEAGEAAFYGPKIGLDVRDAIGREWTIGTVQVDFNIPERLDLVYVDEANEERRPVVVHRALLGSLDRFMGVLIEHLGGDFPTWLAPEQVRVLPVTEDDREYAREVADALDAFRVDVEDRDWTLGKKIRAAHDDRVPYMLVVGSEEAADGTVSVRDRAEREAGPVDLAAFREHLDRECRERRLDPDFLADG
jgi:threonyl-tRNA synthetase